jgi:hypothetical protein
MTLASGVAIARRAKTSGTMFSMRGAIAGALSALTLCEKNVTPFSGSRKRRRMACLPRVSLVQNHFGEIIFLLDVQAHYTGVNGVPLDPELVEGGQLLMMKMSR